LAIIKYRSVFTIGSTAETVILACINLSATGDQKYFATHSIPFFTKRAKSNAPTMIDISDQIPKRSNLKLEKIARIKLILNLKYSQVLHILSG
jgi:hypothetical protein